MKTVCGALLALTFLLSNSRAPAIRFPAAEFAATRPAWEEAGIVQLPRLRVSLSRPVLVTRSKGYLWFPVLVRFDDGSLLALMSTHPDVATNSPRKSVAWSADGGLNWSEPPAPLAISGGGSLRLPGGDQLIIPFNLSPRAEGAIGANTQVVSAWNHQISADPGVTVSGWPRPLPAPSAGTGLSSFVFNRQCVEIGKDRHLSTLYGTFKGSSRYCLLTAESDDGLHWKIGGTIADEHCALPGGEGPCEAALCRLKDRRLLCVFRLGSGAPYGQSWSSDDGKTWTTPAAMKNMRSVEPCLLVMPNGAVILSGGRPGLDAWINADGLGSDWQHIDLRAHHNRCERKEPIAAAGQTSAYTHLVALDETHLLYIYDRIPFSWNAIPKGSAETNSVWVVRITVDRTAS